MNIEDKIARWWQGRGFGIQSKSDYEYLKDVIKESLPYYAYDKIKTERARLIYRICLHENQKGRKVTLAGNFTDEELAAARSATKCDKREITHLHGQETVIINDIDSDQGYAQQLWHQALKAEAITWDMGSIGVVRFIEGRFPEHYSI